MKPSAIISKYIEEHETRRLSSGVKYSGSEYKHMMHECRIMAIIQYLDEILVQKVNYTYKSYCSNCSREMTRENNVYVCNTCKNWETS